MYREDMVLMELGLGFNIRAKLTLMFRVTVGCG